MLPWASVKAAEFSAPASLTSDTFPWSDLVPPRRPGSRPMGLGDAAVLPYNRRACSACLAVGKYPTRGALAHRDHLLQPSRLHLESNLLAMPASTQSTPSWHSHVAVTGCGLAEAAHPSPSRWAAARPKGATLWASGRQRAGPAQDGQGRREVAQVRGEVGGGGDPPGQVGEVAA